VKIRYRYQWAERIAAVLCVQILRVLYWTCRISVDESFPGSSPYRSDQPNGEKYLYSIWHDIILMAMVCRQPVRMAGLVSRHQDGGYLARAMKMRQILPIRGSSRHGGDQAVKQCLNAAVEHHISITPDGPRGPRHRLKDGIVFLASHSGRKILPVSARCRRYWRIPGKWTDMLLPQPFTQVLIRAGEPMTVPPNLSREEIRQYVAQLEAIMREFEEETDRMMHPENHPNPATNDDYFQRAA